MTGFDRLKEKEDDKSNGQSKVPNSLGNNQKKDGKERDKASDEDREWRHWGINKQPTKKDGKYI